MENKFTFIKPFFLILLSVFFTGFAAAQDYTQNNGAYYITEDEDGKQEVHQQFTWNKDDNVLKYVFVMEELNRKGNYVEIVREETSKAKIETILEAGKYRYKIYAYNFLDQLEIETEWIDVEIIKAYQPKISDAIPGVIYMEEEQDGIFTINGSNFTEDTTFSLSTSHKNEDGKYKAEVLEAAKNGSHVKIQFDPKVFDTGKYSLIATNPGGLRYFHDYVVIKWKKPMDFDVSLGLAPLFVLYDSTIPKEIYFGSIFFPVSPNLRLTYIPLKKKTMSFGVALSTTGTWLYNDYDNRYKVSGILAMSNLQLVYQKYLYKRKLMLDVHAGAGVTAFLDTRFTFPLSDGTSIKAEAFNSFYVNANAGFCFQYYFTKRFYLEAGVDFQHSFIKDMPFGTIEPCISAGYQF